MRLAARAKGSSSSGRRTLSERYFSWRNRVLASPTFQRWAASFPFTRWIARRRAAALFDICAGFVYSQVLLACVRVRLFEALAAEPLTIAELSRQTGLPPAGVQRLAEAAAALRLTERRGDRFGLGVLGAALLGNPSVVDMIEHHVLLYRDLVDPLPLLRGDNQTTELRAFWAYRAAADGSEVAGYSTLMASTQKLIVEDVLEAYPLEKKRCLLDVGGGQGAFVAEAGRRWPNLELMLFDLPSVADRARRNLERDGLSVRSRVVGGDVFSDVLPKNADVISLVRVIHDHSDADALVILRKTREAAPPGGMLLLAEPMAETYGAEAMGNAYFGFYLMAMGQGRPRSPSELLDLVARAGWRGARLVRTRRPILVRMIVAST